MNINQETFEAYVFSQPLYREFIFVEGKHSDSTGCLMCNFLRETTNIKEFEVRVVEVRINDKFYPLPEWFIELMDSVRSFPYTVYSPFNIKSVKEKYIQLFGNPVIKEIPPKLEESAEKSANLLIDKELINC